MCFLSAGVYLSIDQLTGHNLIGILYNDTSHRPLNQEYGGEDVDWSLGFPVFATSAECSARHRICAADNTRDSTSRPSQGRVTRLKIVDCRSL